MFSQNKIQVTSVILLFSTILGVTIGFLILQEETSKWTIYPHKASQENLQLTARFRNNKLVVFITNLGGSEVEIQIIFLEGNNYMDFDIPVNLAVKSGETAEIQTNIIQPDPGTYTVKVRLSNGQTISCKITVWE